MFVILSYDVNREHVSKVMKIRRKYLVHVYESVFEGTITEAKLKSLKKELEQLIDTDEDLICQYEMDSVKFSRKEQIGRVVNFSNII